MRSLGAVALVSLSGCGATRAADAGSQAPAPTPGTPPPGFSGKDGQIVTDQLRTVDRERLVRPLGRLAAPTLARLLDVLQEMFAP